MSANRLTRRERKRAKLIQGRPARGDRRTDPAGREEFEEDIFKLTAVMDEYLNDGVPPIIFEQGTGRSKEIPSIFFAAYKAGRLREVIRNPERVKLGKLMKRLALG